MEMILRRTQCPCNMPVLVARLEGDLKKQKDAEQGIY